MADAKDFESTTLGCLDTVYRAAYALCGRAETAEDLVQVTYAKALERFGSFRTGTNCKAWLLSILRNTWIDELRHRRAVGLHASVDDLPLAEPARQEPTVWSDASDVLENFADEQVIDALRELSDEQRLTLFLVDVEQLNHDEVAQIMNVAVGTVKSRSSRARSTLKQRLLHYAEDMGFVEREP